MFHGTEFPRIYPYIQQYFTEGDTKPTGFSEVKTFERYSLNPRGETSTTTQYHRDSRPPKMPTATLEWYSNGWEFNL